MHSQAVLPTPNRSKEHSMEFPSPTFEELAWFGLIVAFAAVFGCSWLHRVSTPHIKAVRDWYINRRIRRSTRK